MKPINFRNIFYDSDDEELYDIEYNDVEEDSHEYKKLEN